MKNFILCFLTVVTASVSAQNIYTVAGTGSAAYAGDGGPATSAHISNLGGGVAFDASGNMYIPDYGNNAIRKVDAVTGIITTVAGTGVNGYNGDGILATTAQLYGPDAVAVDASGNIFIADYSNNRIRKVDYATGLISTVAGTGVYGYNGDSILATTAQVKEITGLAIDTSGNLYFTDLGNACVRKIDATNGVVYTVAGNGTQGYNGDNIPALSAELNFPYGIAVDMSGNVFIADNENHRVRKVNAANGVISTVAGTGNGGYNGDGIAATTADIYHPWGVAVDAAGNLFIADSWNNRIRKVNASNSQILTVAGNGNQGSVGDGGPATSAEISTRGVAVDGCGNIYISQYYSPKVRKVTAYLVTVTSTDVLCNAACTGTVNANASGGNSPYTYSWNGGLGNGAAHSNVCAGNYSVTVTDSTGCVETIPLTITEPTAISISVSHVNTGCSMSNGSAAATVTGGTGVYSFSWSNTSTNDTITGLGPGTYTLVVTDTNNCSASQSVTIINNPTPPASIPVCMVTVDAQSQNNIIVWDKTSNTRLDSFIVYREISTNNYQRIGALPYDSLSQFIDTVRTLYFPNTGDPNAGTYRYKIKCVDSCGNYSSLSPYHNTIFITQNNGTFSWTQLYTIESGPNPVNSYVLLRDNLSNGNWIPVSSVAGTQQTISDPNYSTYAATASWRIQTVWNITCTPTYRLSSPEIQSLNSSYSNIVGIAAGLNSPGELPGIKLYPTVNNGNFTLEIPANVPAQVEIYSAVGGHVLSFVADNTTSKVDLGNYADGIYFVRVMIGDQLIVKKIVKQ